MTDTDRLAGLAALLDNRQMPDDATPNVTMGDLRALRAAILAPTLPDARHLEPPITVSYLYAMLAHIEAIHPVEGICYGRGDCATVYGMPAPTPPDALRYTPSRDGDMDPDPHGAWVRYDTDDGWQERGNPGDDDAPTPSDALDVERLARVIDAVEEGGVRNGVFERLTTIDNGRLARSIAREYAALSDPATSTDKCPSCGVEGLPPLVCESCGHRWYGPTWAGWAR